jgi:hypothetical protein
MNVEYNSNVIIEEFDIPIITKKVYTYYKNKIDENIILKYKLNLGKRVEIYTKSKLDALIDFGFEEQTKNMNIFSKSTSF